MHFRNLLAALSLALALLTTTALAEDTNPMKDIVGAVAVDGMALISRSEKTPFTLRVLDGDSKQTRAADNQVWIATPKRQFQITLVPIAKFVRSKLAEEKLLELHADWESQHHNELTKQKVEPKLASETINKRTWAFWNYDLSPFWNKMKAENPDIEKQTPGPKTQHFLTTVLGENILVIVCTTLNGQSEEETKNLMLKSAATFETLPAPLSDAEIKAYCAKPAQGQP